MGFVLVDPGLEQGLSKPHLLQNAVMHHYLGRMDGVQRDSALNPFPIALHCLPLPRGHLGQAVGLPALVHHLNLEEADVGLVHCSDETAAG